MLGKTPWQNARQINPEIPPARQVEQKWNGSGKSDGKVVKIGGKRARQVVEKWQKSGTEVEQKRKSDRSGTEAGEKWNQSGTEEEK